MKASEVVEADLGGGVTAAEADRDSSIIRMP
jgi:hypothetical protein